MGMKSSTETEDGRRRVDDYLPYANRDVFLILNVFLL